MAAPCSLDVEIRGIGAVYMPHDLRKVTDRGFDQEVIMVVHQAECVDNRIVPFGGRLNLAASGAAFSTGPPWCDLLGISYCHCNISGDSSLAVVLKNQVWARD